MINITSKKCIFFDLDGVLVDSREMHFRAFQAALKHYQIDLTKEEHDVQFDGLPTSKKLKIIQEKNFLTEADVLNIEKIKQEITLDMIENEIVEDLALSNLLQQLSNQFVLFVCSNSKLKTVKLILKKLKIDSNFQEILSQQQVAKPKPSPLIYLEAQKRSGFFPYECLIVEDSPHGIAAAIEAGMDYCVVKNVQETKSLISSFII